MLIITNLMKLSMTHCIFIFKFFLCVLHSNTYSKTFKDICSRSEWSCVCWENCRNPQNALRISILRNGAEDEFRGALLKHVAEAHVMWVAFDVAWPIVVGICLALRVSLTLDQPIKSDHMSADANHTQFWNALCNQMQRGTHSIYCHPSIQANLGCSFRQRDRLALKQTHHHRRMRRMMCD